MNWLKSTFKKISLRMDLVGLGIMIVFFLFVRRVDPVHDMVSGGNLLYVALGNHGVRVLEVAENPGEPLELGMYNTPGSALGLSLRQAGERTELYVADDNRGIEVFEVSSQGELIHRWFHPDLTPALDIATQGNMAWVAQGENGLSVLKVDSGKPDDQHIWPIQGIPSAVRIEVFENKLFVFDQDWQMYMVFLNTDNPGQSTLSQPYPIGSPVNDLVVYGGMAYLATQDKGLILLDTNQPPENAFRGDYADLTTLQSVVISGAFIYISAGDRGIQVLEVSRPEAIVKVGEITQVQVGQASPIRLRQVDLPEEPILRTIDAQKMILAGNFLYYADGVSGLRVLKPQQNIEVAIADVLGGINNEESWAEDVVVVEGKPASEGGNTPAYAFMAGGDRGLWVFDVTQKEDPKDLPYVIEAGEGVKPLSGNSQAVAGYKDMLYLGFRNRGVQILDVSNPRKIKAYPPILIEADIRALAVQDGAILVSAGSKGLHVIDVQDPNNARVIGSESISTQAEGLSLAAGYAFVAAGGDGLQIVNLQNYQKPTLLNAYPLEGQARGVVVYTHQPDQNANPNRFAYVANGSGGLAILEISPTMEASQILTIPLPGEVQDVFIQGKKLFVTDSQEGLFVFDLSDPKVPIQQGRVDTPGKATAVFTVGDFAYVADQNRGLRIINTANPADLRESGYWDMPTRVKDLVITPDQKYAHLVGDAAGMWTVSLQNPRNPVPLSLLELTGEPSSIELGSDGRAYLGDGSRGFYLVDLSQEPGTPPKASLAAAYTALKDVRRVQMESGFAYAANGDGGLAVLSVADPKAIELKQTFSTRGTAMNVDVAYPYVYIVTTLGKVDIGYIQQPGKLVNHNPETAIDTFLENPYKLVVIPGREQAYVADGNHGLVVVNVHQPLIASQVAHWDTPGKVLDVAISDYYVFLADGEAGVDMVYVPYWWSFSPTAQAYFNFDTSVANAPQNCVPNAQNITFLPHILTEKGGSGEKLLHHYAYIATDQCGLVTLEYTVSMGLEPLGLYATPGEASFGMVVRAYAHVLAAMFKGIWKDGISVIEVPSIALGIARGEIRAMDARIRETTSLFLYALLLLIAGMILWLGILSFFVLPVRTFQEGLQSFKRLGLYFRGFHGLAVRVREGKADSNPLGKRGPGFALVDLNSAITIEEYATRGFISLFNKGKKKRRKKTGENRYQARVSGPGLVFLNSQERVQGAVDLRRQIRLRPQVKGLTQDGIEVLTNVFAGFTLGEDPEILKVTYQGEIKPENLREITLRDGWVPMSGKPNRERQVTQVSRLVDSLDPEDKKEIHRALQAVFLQASADRASTGHREQGPFAFDASRVYKAVVSRPLDVAEHEMKEWTELPAHVAAGIFRDLIHQKSYDSLYQPMEPNIYPIGDLKVKFSYLMRNQGILAFQYFARQDGKPIQEGQNWEPEVMKCSDPQELRNPKPLRSRGTKVVFAGFTELKANHEEVGEILTQFWRAEWQKETELTRADYDQQAMRVINLARAQAETKLVNTLSMIFQDREHTREALAFRIMQALEAVATDPKTRNLLPRDTIQILDHVQRVLAIDEPEEPDTLEPLQNGTD